jgi:hypothetical protein
VAPDALPCGSRAVCNSTKPDIDGALPLVAAELDFELDLVASVQPAPLGADKDVAGAGIVRPDNEAEMPFVIEKFHSAVKYVAQMHYSCHMVLLENVRRRAEWLKPRPVLDLRPRMEPTQTRPAAEFDLFAARQPPELGLAPGEAVDTVSGNAPAAR